VYKNKLDKPISFRGLCLINNQEMGTLFFQVVSTKTMVTYATLKIRSRM
jgi:hypothetical protein